MPPPMSGCAQPPSLTIKCGLAHKGDLIVIASGIGDPTNRHTNLVTVQTINE